MAVESFGLNETAAVQVTKWFCLLLIQLSRLTWGGKMEEQGKVENVLMRTVLANYVQILILKQSCHVSLCWLCDRATGEISYRTQITKDYVYTCPHSISFQAQIQQLGETPGRTCEVQVLTESQMLPNSWYLFSWKKKKNQQMKFLPMSLLSFIACSLRKTHCIFRWIKLQVNLLFLLLEAEQTCSISCISFHFSISFCYTWELFLILVIGSTLSESIIISYIFSVISGQ